MGWRESDSRGDVTVKGGGAGSRERGWVGQPIAGWMVVSRWLPFSIIKLWDTLKRYFCWWWWYCLSGCKPDASEPKLCYKASISNPTRTNTVPPRDQGRIQPFWNGGQKGPKNLLGYGVRGRNNTYPQIPFSHRISTTVSCNVPKIISI